MFFFEIIKSNIYFNENKITEKEKDLFYGKCLERVEKYELDLVAVIEKEKKWLYNYEKKKNISNLFKNQLNPRDIYVNQFEELNKQMSLIRDTFFKLKSNQNLFVEIKSVLLRETDRIKENLTKSQRLLEDEINQFEQIKSEQNIKNQISTLKEKVIYYQSAKQDDYLQILTNFLHEAVSKLKDFEVPVNVSDGFLITKKIVFTKEVQKWLDYELIILLLELINKQQLLNAHLESKMNSIKNGLITIKDNFNESVISHNVSVLRDTKFRVANEISEIEKIQQDIINKLNSEFKVSNIYKDESFLDVKIESTYNKLKLENKSLVDRALKLIKKSFNSFSQSYLDPLLSYEQDNYLESMKLLQSRTQRIQNSYYHSLFYNNDFTGDFFIVPRETQQKSIEESFSLFNYIGHQSILVYGERLSGKTTFIEYQLKGMMSHITSHKITPEEIKNNELLGDHIESLLNRKLRQEKCMVVIEDLELFRTEKASLLVQIKSLVRLLKDKTPNVMFIMSINEEMYEQLEANINFTDYLDVTISINNTSIEALSEAVILRHSASNMKLYKNGVQLHENDIKTMVKRIAKTQSKNIGHILRNWTTIIEQKEDSLVIAPENIYFYNYFNKKELVVLNLIHNYKEVCKNELNNWIGDLNEETYQLSINKLLNDKVLCEKNMRLSINPILLCEIGDILNKKEEVL